MTTNPNDIKPTPDYGPEIPSSDCDGKRTQVKPFGVSGDTINSANDVVVINTAGEIDVTAFHHALEKNSSNVYAMLADPSAVESDLKGGAVKAFIKAEVKELIGAAPDKMNSIKELYEALAEYSEDKSRNISDSVQDVDRHLAGLRADGFITKSFSSTMEISLDGSGRRFKAGVPSKVVADGLTLREGLDYTVIATKLDSFGEVKAIKVELVDPMCYADNDVSLTVTTRACAPLATVAGQIHAPDPTDTAEIKLMQATGQLLALSRVSAQGATLGPVDFPSEDAENNA